VSAERYDDLEDLDGASMDNEPLTDDERDELRRQIARNAAPARRRSKSTDAPPYRKHHPAASLADTMTFSAAEVGALLLLKDHLWCAGSLPDDDDELRRLARLTPPQWKKSRSRIADEFDQGWSHAELEAERAATIKSINRMKAGGRVGGIASGARRRDES
jgi:uncharacterized protein YdaU (DUF1376 family)